MIEKLLKKHAKNYVTSERLEGKLEGIHYHKNGSIYVTDAHQILAIKDVHNEKPHTVHYKTGELMDVEYPDVAKLLDMEYRDSIPINVKELRKYVPLIKLASSIDMAGCLIAEIDSLLYLKVQNIEESFQLVLAENVDYLKINLNVMYFYYMLNFFKDVNVDEIIFRHNGPVRPMSFTAENYEIIILPTRRY